MKAGSVSALAKVADRSLSQAWSRYFYEHPQGYQTVDGILYRNAHNDAEAIALYERANDNLAQARVKTLPLDSIAIRHLISQCAIDNNLILNYVRS